MVRLRFQTRRLMMALVVMTPLVAAAGLTLSSASPASAQAVCTGSSAFLVDTVPRITVNIPTVGNQTFNDNCEMQLGDVSPAVGVLQNNLNSHCANGQDGRLTVDDSYGPLTREAVIDAQSHAHIPADGIYGPQTRDHIHWNDSAGQCITF
jgi:peptidoglycan hydrolase-like protein with peptidoglycan-binding domain